VSSVLLATMQRLGVLGALGGTILSLGCCAGLLGPVGSILLAGSAVDWVPAAWRLPVLYGSVAVTLVSFALGWRRHRRLAPLGLSLMGAAALLYPLHEALDVSVFQMLIWLGVGSLWAGAAGETWLAIHARPLRPERHSLGCRSRLERSR
jgi:hypothetical protein